jgi:hypothetical protein
MIHIIVIVAAAAAAVVIRRSWRGAYSRQRNCDSALVDVDATPRIARPHWSFFSREKAPEQQ